jgi:LPS-assembly protein
LGEFGFDAMLRTSGKFDYQNPRWGINGLRHLLTPRVSYRYIPEGDRGRGRIPIDRQAFSTYLAPLGLGATRNLDDLHAIHTLRLGLDNTLQTRDAGYGSRDLFTVNLAGDFRFKRNRNEREFSRGARGRHVRARPLAAGRRLQPRYAADGFAPGAELRDHAP